MRSEKAFYPYTFYQTDRSQSTNTMYTLTFFVILIRKETLAIIVMADIS